MKINKVLLLGIVVLAVTLVANASPQQRGPSTPEERKRAVEIATLLENDPLNQNARTLSSELLVFLIQVPDIHVHMCTDVLGDYKKIKGDYSPNITFQLTFSQAKFVIEHPEKADDQYQEYLAGVEGALMAYEKIKLAKPKVKMEPLEELLAKKQAGQLGEFVKSAMANCKSE